MSIGFDGVAAVPIEVPHGNLDGLLQLGDGILLSSWEGKGVYRYTAPNSLVAVVEGLDSPGDIGFDAARQRLLVPLVFEGRVEVYSLK